LVPPRWQGAGATIVVLILTITLVVLDVADRGVHRFWATHALTTDTVAGLLVLALTVLVVNQVLNQRSVTQRSRAVAAQAGALLAQAKRAMEATLAFRDGKGGREPASDELRSYLLMLLVSAPVLIEDPVARRFLEQAQGLAAQMAHVVNPSEMAALNIGVAPAGGLESAVDGLRGAAAPLLAVLKADERFAVTELSTSG
jgi:hypothetical protein